MSGLYIAIEIGGTKLQVFVGNASGRIEHRRRLTVDRKAGGVGIRRQIELALPELLEQWKPRAVAVGFGGPVDWRTGQICCSHQIEGWADFQLGDWLKERTSLPVRI